jgi:hypothetical protein
MPLIDPYTTSRTLLSGSKPKRTTRIGAILKFISGTIRGCYRRPERF